MTAPNPDDLPPVLREMLVTGTFRNAAGATQPLHSNISLNEALAIYGLVRALRPSATAEIGFALGVSGLAILGALEANGAGRHYVADPGQTSFVQGAGLENVRRAGLPHRLDFFEKLPEEVFPGLPPLQFVFIDASHLFDLTILDFVLADKRLEVGGVIGLHDLLMPSLQKVVRYVLANRAYRPHIANAVPPPLTPRQRMASTVAAVARRLPGAHRLAPETLKPWHEFRFDNMVFLEKTGPDNRDWRHHVVF